VDDLEWHLRVRNPDGAEHHSRQAQTNGDMRSAWTDLAGCHESLRVFTEHSFPDSGARPISCKRCTLVVRK
jgi:hypothetical protein